MNNMMNTVEGDSMKTLLSIITLTGLFIFSVSTTNAASFDCKKAQTFVEKEICADAEISNLDERLHAAYKKSISNTNEKELTKKEQKEWLENIRNACRERVCIKTAYEKRLAALQGTNKEAVTTNQKYPPYPDVWGYELLWPETNNRDIQMTHFRMGNGDIYTTYVMKRDLSRGRDGQVFAWLEFFSGKKKKLSPKEYNAFWQTNRDKELGTGLPVLSQITFSDGSRITRAGSGGGGACYAPFVHALAAYNKDGKQIARKALVYLLKEPRIVTYSSRCPDAQGEVIERAQAQLLKLIELEDDTFLVYESNGNTILRLDKRLNTKYPLGNRIYLVDWKVIERLREQARYESKGDVHTAHQKLNDSMAEYLHSYKGENIK